MRSTVSREEMLEELERQYNGEWVQTRWYRVIDLQGSLSLETSDIEEAREAMRPGDTLQYLWRREEHEWRGVPPGYPETHTIGGVPREEINVSYG